MLKIKQLFKNALRINVLAWKYVKVFLISSFLIAFVEALLPFASSGVNALLINHLSLGFGKGVIDQTLLLLAITSSVLLFLPDIVFSFKNFVERRIWIDLSNAFQVFYFKKKSEIDIQTHEDPNFQDILNKAEDRNIYPLINSLDYQVRTFSQLFSVIFSMSVLFVYNWKIFLIVLIAILPQFVIELKYNNNAWTIWDAEVKLRRRYANLLEHFNVKNWLIELKLFQNVSNFYQKIVTILSSFSGQQRKIEKKKLTMELVSALFSGVIIGGVCFWIIFSVVKGTTEIGTMLFVITSIQSFQRSLSAFISNLSGVHKQDMFVNDIFKVIDTSTVLPRSANPVMLDGSTPEIVFENVSFHYPGKDNLILENINLTIKAGENFALVGENGAGKTTFVKLLCRIYDPTGGRILINGIDLKEIDLESWYKTLGILFQEYAPYKFEVKETIALGRSDEEFDMERIINAAKSSESESFILNWKDKYDQMLGTEFENGLDPSKGQQQRLAIARLMHRRAGVLILDEPTASIDAEAEKKIFEQIEKEAKDQTVILISHKFSTVRGADRICVFKEKGVAEIGTHNELIKLGGIYARLFAEQLKGYTKED